jgi:Skp family chaperone for outer membrane proteins
MQDELIIVSVANVAVCAVAIVLMLWMFSRWEKRSTRRTAAASREMRSLVQAEKDRLRTETQEIVRKFFDGFKQSASERERAVAANTIRLDEFAKRLEDFRSYQESIRELLERSRSEMESRLHTILSGASESDAKNYEMLREKLPLLEESLSDFSERCGDLSQSLRRLVEQQKAVSEKSDAARSPEEAVSAVRQARALLVGAGNSLAEAAELLDEADESVREFVRFFQSIFRVCDFCAKSGLELSVCLNCGKKYCDECRGQQIGHCKKCAPSPKPLHIDIGEA